MAQSFFSRWLEHATEEFNKIVPWHRLPTLLGIVNLVELRNVLRERNLFDTGTLPQTAAPQARPFEERFRRERTADGSNNDLGAPTMGMVGTRFGRNVPFDKGLGETGEALLSPSPRLISRRLMTREQFQPASTLNLLAAAWIQFQIHGWFAHGKGDGAQHVTVPLDEADPWPERPMRVPLTARDPTRPDAPDGGPPTYLNHTSHWWDASQLYGSDDAAQRGLRSLAGGKLLLDEEGRLPLDPERGIERTGFNDNWWVGLSLLHTLFAREHNAICDALHAEHPELDDEALFQKARLINGALMAKIHTVEWTCAILNMPTLQVGMNANWWGLASEEVHKLVGRISESEVLSGIPGSPVDHHGVPFAMTEEFVAVYRMHPLMPDRFDFHGLDGRLLLSRDLREVAGRRAREVLEKVPMLEQLFSLGIANPGAITLHNYPRGLQDLETQDGLHLDLAAVDVIRDRERGVPRYNEFRRLMHMEPVRSFEELTHNPTWAAELAEVYGGDMERVDLQVGLFAEVPPEGFGFSDTAFRIFILMASRRLKSDRFFTTDYTEEVYTALGLRWIGEHTMGSVLRRHFPALGEVVHPDNAFFPWRRPA